MTRHLYWISVFHFLFFFCFLQVWKKNVHRLFILFLIGISYFTMYKIHFLPLSIYSYSESLNGWVYIEGWEKWKKVLWHVLRRVLKIQIWQTSQQKKKDYFSHYCHLVLKQKKISPKISRILFWKRSNFLVFCFFSKQFIFISKLNFFNSRKYCKNWNTVLRKSWDSLFLQ